MLVSVVVPAYNEENYVGKCLEALAAQVHPGFDLEIIVVDNGSTDRTADVARLYGARVVDQPRRGVAHARQAGFEAARGEIIASTDADSAPPPDWLHSLVTELLRHPGVLGVYGPARVLDGTRFEDLGVCYLGAAVMALSKLLGRPTFLGVNFAVWREAWVRVGGFDTSWQSAEDNYLSRQLSRIGKVRFCPGIRVPTSARRRQQGIPAMMLHTARNYTRVFWLDLPPLPYSNYR